MEVMGFSKAKPRTRASPGPDQGADAMLQCLADLANGDEAIHIRDPFLHLPPRLTAAGMQRKGQETAEIRGEALQCPIKRPNAGTGSTLVSGHT